MKLILLTILSLLLFVSPCFAAPADMAVTVTGAGDNSGTAGDGTTLEWDNAMAMADWEADYGTNTEAGDTYYVAGGTYTLIAALNDGAIVGTSLLPISIIGVDAGTTAEPPTTADWAYGTDRPVLAFGANNLSGEDYYFIANLSVTGTNANLVFVDIDNTIYNVKAINNSGTANRAAFMVDDRTNVIGCEGKANDDGGNAGKAFYFPTTPNSSLLYSYAHDSKTGLDSTSATSIHIGNVFDTCSVEGINASNDEVYLNNTFYNCAIGISGNVNNIVVANNVFDECTIPISMTTDNLDNFFAFNNFDGDESSNVNVTPSYLNLDTDITLTDPTGSPPDFTLPDSTVAEGSGMQVGTDTGLTGDYNWNMGVDQTDTQAGGGGGTTSYGFSN